MKRRREEETKNRDAPVSTADILINRNVREALYLSICKDKVNREEEREREREREREMKQMGFPSADTYTHTLSPEQSVCPCSVPVTSHSVIMPLILRVM